MSMLKNQVVVITGGSRGIGLSIARAVHARGARVVLMARDAAGLEAARAELGDVLTFPVDVTDPASVAAALHDVVRVAGRVDVLINNAGLALASPVEKATLADIQAQINVNFLAVVLSCQAVIPLMKAQGGGRILNVSSALVKHPEEFPHLSVYAATKAAVERFTEELREEVKAQGIAVTLFRPGATLTGFGFNWAPEILEAAYAEWEARAPLCDGFMEPEVVGEAAASALELPLGVAYDVLELRPCTPMAKRGE